MSFTRLHARVSVQAPAAVQAHGENLSYEISNLSIGGALLVGAESLPEGTVTHLQFVLGEGEPVQVRARVVRSQVAGDGRQALAVVFVDVPAEADAQISRAVTEAYKNLGAKVLGLVRQELGRQGVTDIRVVADELHRIKLDQVRSHMFAADLFTRHGSNAAATVVSASTGAERECIVWSLNLYLGLNRHPRVIEKSREAVAVFGTGCGTSAPSGGMSALHNQIGTRVAAMVGKEQAVVFSTGYAANLGSLSALPGPKDLVLLDREAHASMIDGVKLSGRKWMAFKHNDVADLADKLERFSSMHENVFVVVESAYSMSGDLCPLREIVALKDRFRFLLFVDEAHTFGFYGEGGRGYCHAQGVTAGVDFIMSTFSKSTASIGGFIASEARFCTLLQASATAYIFQACLPPGDAAAILASLDEIQGNPEHARRLHENNRYMRELLVREGFDLGTSQSPVIPVYIPDLEKLYRMCAHLYQEGIFSVPIVYPAVGVNEGRIRFIVNAHHTTAQIERTVSALSSHGHALGILGR